MAKPKRAAAARSGTQNKAKKNKTSSQKSKRIRQMRNSGFTRSQIRAIFDDEERQARAAAQLAKSMQRNIR